MKLFLCRRPSALTASCPLCLGCRLRGDDALLGRRWRKSPFRRGLAPVRSNQDCFITAGEIVGESGSKARYNDSHRRRLSPLMPFFQRRHMEFDHIDV